MAQVTRNIPHNSDLERRILDEIKQRVRFWESRVSSKLDKWRQAEEKVLAFVHETEVTRKRKKDRADGRPDYTTIQIPYSYAVVMSALTYVTSVFLGRTPILQYSGRHGESQQQVQALEALIDYQLMNGYMLPTLYTWFYDALKYGYGIVGLYWDERIEMVSEMMPQPQQGLMGMMGQQPNFVPIQIPMRTYAGNKIFNVQPQDFIWDARFPAREFQRGEYCGRRFVMGWNEVVRKQKAGQYINVEFIKTQGQDTFAFNMGSDQLERAEAYSGSSNNFSETISQQKAHPQSVRGIEMVIELIPKEWGLGPSDWPEKWVLTCTASFDTLIGISPLGALHCSYPYAIFPLEPEGYGLTIRGMPEVLDPVQNTIDWLINSHFYNVRAALNNRSVVDPSRVVMKDVLDPLPGGIIRLKPVAYGTDTKTAVTQLQTMDVTQQHLPNVGFMTQFGERIIGVNDQIMGMLDTGGRKTATEVRTSTSMGVNRLKFLAEFGSSTGMDPLSKMMVQNTQQYYDMELKMKIAGDLLQGAGQNFIMVDPMLITGFYDFVPVDGTLPIDRFAQVNLWKELIQACLTVPQIGLQYDLAGIFQWVAQLAGLKNITQFRVQVRPDQMLAMMAQQGNAVPLSGPNAGGQSAKQPKAASDTQQGYQQANAAPQQAPMMNGAA